ncbi:hypothetical protein NXS98_02435 [Fontisphaera persica]|uniref:hypothetical protein n=1 Tax=Fontisphaera persica TaxID=2974023 RepID=UPI0024BFFD09|nr:hypothetical protein [Fontisphaera persica]WCJ60005.1 hypothetical protein NXS98_02435 [Fontisphaera persica]
MKRVIPAGSDWPAARKMGRMVLVAALFCLTGCFVISVNPFYEEKNVFFEPALLGRWEGEGQRWRFEPAEHEAKAYFVTYSADGKESKMTGHLFKLDDQWFLNLFGQFAENIVPPPIPSHYVVRVRLEDGKLALQGLDYKWMRDWLKKNPKALRHQWRTNPGDDPSEAYFVLTAETGDLQEFLRKQMKNAEAWSDRITLTRPDER